MTKTFNIIKKDSRRKIAGEWTAGEWETVIDTIEARNRREAFAIYCEGISKGYHVNRRNLTARREGRNKRRRVEILSVKEAEA